MFENEIAINRHHMRGFLRITGDVPEEATFQPSPGHGHPPAWIMGHLAATGELGQRLLGGAVAHPEWAALFGPGSSDKVLPAPGLSKEELVHATDEAYQGLQRLAASANPDAMSRRHEIKLFEGTPIETVGHCISLLLTSHFAFHLAQLSSCRRAAGHPALF
jgi:hypothetical protein